MPDERDMPDVDDLKVIEEVITWLREASVACAETAEYSKSREDRADLEGRAAAFGLAARLVEDVIRRGQE